MRLRPYQQEAATAALDELRTHWSTLVVLPTGAGKTVVFTAVADRWRKSRVLILAHREELVMQAANKVQEATGEQPGIEMADQNSLGVSDGTLFGGGSHVVVGSVQSVCRPNRLARLDPDDFGLIVVDEAHHCTPQNGSYWAIVQHFRQNADCRLLGVTATPDRADELALGQVFEAVAYEMSILDAIEGGWLVPIEQQFVRVEGLDFSSVRTTAGDLNDADLDALMSQDGGRLLHEIASATVDAAKEEPVLIFANSVRSAEAIARIVNRYPGKRAECLHGATSKEDRRYQLGQFAAGAYQFLVGCDLFLEGFDSPRIAVVSNAKPTKSRARYTQCVGRGTRTLPAVISDTMTQEERLAAIAASAKPRCLVLDFVGNSGRHKLICTADILAGKTAPAAVIRAVADAKDAGEPVDMRKAIDGAARKIQEEHDRRVAEANAEEERRRMEWLRAQARYTAETVDPFGWNSGLIGGQERGLDRSKRPTDKQIRFLQSRNMWSPSLTKAQARQLIGSLMKSFRGDLCSPRQSQVLEKAGENPRSTRDQAKVLLDILATRGWAPRDYRLTRDRWSIRKEPDGKFRPMVVDPTVGKIGISATFRTLDDAKTFISGCVESEANDAETQRVG